MKAVKNLTIGVVLFSVAWSVSTHGQLNAYWQVASAFPDGPKTSITLVKDSVLLVSSTTHVYKSANFGHSWETILQKSSIFHLFTANTGRIFATGAGKMFFTDNLGLTWDSLMFSHNYPITKIIQNIDYTLIAITGALDIEKGFVGEGVYVSYDNGNTWIQRNNGLGKYLSCQQIANDKNGTLYLGVADEYVTGMSGLFVSKNNGLEWIHIDISINGKKIIPDDIQIESVNGLSITPHDSVFISFFGVADNVGVRLNLLKHIDDLQLSDFWQVRSIFKFITWWDDQLLTNIHFSGNGDWYSSIIGLSAGGTFRSADSGVSWVQHQQGLGLNLFNRFDVQHFAETSDGLIFMIQSLDERIYQTTKSIVVPEIPEHLTNM